MVNAYKPLLYTYMAQLALFAPLLARGIRQESGNAYSCGSSRLESP